MPKTIGKYELKKKLGEGGFGVVWLARDTVLGDEVALKVAFAAEEHRASLLKEARLLRSLNHANIVRVFEADLADEAIYIAMEYLPGGNLSERMAPGTIALDETLGISRQLLAALQYAHGRSILHRDVKPANVLFDAEGTAKLTDFGVARMLRHTQAASTRIGTVPYMAPEQLVGEAVFRSDLYAAGVLLYEMATGARAFEGDTDFIVMQKISNGQFKRPREANGDVPPWIEDVIIKVMDRDPAKRFATADDFARALAPPAEAVTAGVEEAAARTAEIHRTKAVTKATPAPDLVGKELAPAETLVRGAGLALRIGGRRHHPSATAGSVVEQEPAAGSPVNPGAAVDVVLSEGPEEILVEVPAFTAMPFDEAEGAASKAGLEIKAAAREYHPSLEEGKVISQDVEPGSSVKAGAVVALVISNGPELVKVADFAGKPFEKVKAAAAKAGFEVEVAAREHHPSLAAGAVISQDVEPGSSVRAGAVVALVLSEGPELVKVPAFTGMPFDKAEGAAAKVGLEVKVAAREHHPSFTEGEVIGQDVEPGSLVKAGAVVALVLSKGPAFVKVPDFVGLPPEEAKGRAEANRLRVRVKRREFDSAVAEGNVASQSIRAGTSLSAGATVELTVSKGPEPPRVEVPDVTGVSLGDAEAAAVAGDLRLRVASRKYSDLPAGVVLRQRVEAGAKMAPGSTVAVAVSKGAKPVREFPAINWRKAGIVAGGVGVTAAVVVILVIAGVFSPDRETKPAETPADEAESVVIPEAWEPGSVIVASVKGKDEKAACAALEETGFKVAVERRESPTVKRGVVIEQRPAGGEETLKGAEVTLVVSTGKPGVKAPTPSVRETLVAVPRVAGMAAANARVRLANAGFGVRSVSRASDRVAAGYVISQGPAGSGRRGATVTIYVSTGPARGGTTVEPTAYCPGCGAPRAPGAKFCGKCGYNF